jgi:drug/metabolite transporter (DMT)-like permease
MFVLPESWLVFRGEIAALTAAALWSVSSLIYSWIGQEVSALLLNILKSCAAIVMLIGTIVLKQTGMGEPSLGIILPLLLSGAIGIGLGDTAFFKVLKALGARQALLLETLAPPLTAILGLIFLQEQLSLQAWLGILTTIVGVAWVLSERTAQVSAGAFSLQRLQQGLVWAFIAELAQASGILLSRSVFLQVDISPLWSTLIRISAGTLTALVIFGVQFQKSKLGTNTPSARKRDLSTGLHWPRILTPRLIWGVCLASFGGTFLGIWLQQTAIKYTLAGIAQTLSATSPLFSIPIAVLYGESVSLRSVLGAIVSILGIGMLFAASG